MPWRSLRSPHHRDCAGCEEQHCHGRDLHEACSDYFGVFFSIHSIGEPFGGKGFALSGKCHDRSAGLRGGCFSTHINQHINFLGNVCFGRFYQFAAGCPSDGCGSVGVRNAGGHLLVHCWAQRDAEPTSPFHHLNTQRHHKIDDFAV